METRNYMDYQLAYDGYKKVKEILETNGIDGINKQFNSMSGYFKDNNRMITFYYEDYNTYITLFNGYIKDTSIKEWYVSNELGIIGYNGANDNLIIDNKNELENRLNRLGEWGIQNNYTREDYRLEKESLINVLAQIV